MATAPAPTSAPIAPSAPAIPQGKLTSQQIAQARSSLTAMPNNGQPDSFGIDTPTKNSNGSNYSFTDSVANNFSNAQESLANAWRSFSSNAGDDINQIASGLTSGKGQGIKGVGKEIMGAGAGVTNLLGDSVTAIFAPFSAAIQGVSGTASDNPTVQKVANAPGVSSVADTVNNVSSKVNSWAQANPDKAKLAQNAFNVVLSVLGDATGAPEQNIPNIKEPISTISNDIKGAASKVKDAMTPAETPEAAPAPTLSSRIQDATPDYNPKMVGTNVKTPDITDAQGNVTEGKITPRIASEGKGLTGERPVTTSASESAAGTELNNIKDYPDRGTALEKMLSTQKAISTEAESMRSGLQAEDKATPLDAAAEKAKVSDLVKSNLPQDIKDRIGYISSEDEAKLPPAAKQYRDIQISQQEETMPKTAAGRYYQQVLDAVKNYNGTREGKLDLRQTIDNAYANARGKLAWGSDSQNALDETNTDIRNGLNKDLADTTKNTDTQASLQKQTNLYRAHDVLTAKAQAEAATAFGKIEQKYPSLRNLVRTAQRQGIYIPLRILETVAGVSLVGAFLRKAIAGN